MFGDENNARPFFIRIFAQETLAKIAIEKRIDRPPDGLDLSDLIGDEVHHEDEG